MGIVIGVDVGQKRDPTAICVAEAVQREGAWHYLVHLLERLRLGTPYPAVAKRVGEIVDRTSQRVGKRPRVFVDATGVGQPLVDLLKEQFSWVLPVYFTYGNRRNESSDRVSIGKAWLVSRLQALLQNGRIHLPQMAESHALARELMSYEIRVDQNATDRYGAFRVGTHDDLVTALGLAVQDNPTELRYS